MNNILINQLPITDTWSRVTVIMLVLFGVFNLASSSILSRCIRKSPCRELEEC
jgi:hypothetical protein